MRVLFFGDVVGRAGRNALVGALPVLRSRLAVDCVVVNGENAAHGFGITARLCQELFENGVDVITLGNHAWDQRDLLQVINDEPRIVRPLNFPPGTPGRGITRVETPAGPVVVAQVMGRLYTEPLDDPFAAVEQALAPHPLGRDARAVVVDVHAEATAEKVALGHALDGRATLVAGTHTHIPTADAHVLPGGTAYITDVGMCGDYDSVIGMRKEGSLHRFRHRVPGERLVPADGEATVCAVLVESDSRTGLAQRIVPLRLGGVLAPGVTAMAAAKGV